MARKHHALQIYIPLLFLSFLFLPETSFSFEADGSYGYTNTPVAHVANHKVSTPVQRVAKFNAALKALGIPLENAPSELATLPGSGKVNQSEFQNNLKYIDGFGAVKDYLNVRQGSLELYNDFYTPNLSSKYLEFSTTFKTSGPSEDESAKVTQKLKQIAAQHFKSQFYSQQTFRPLTGLKVAIDPGHMGGEKWDEHTGKFMQPIGQTNGRNDKVSEGDLNLQTSMLLASQLEALGAEVRLTRYEQEAVATETLENYNKRPYRERYIYNGLDSWANPFMRLKLSSLISNMKSFLAKSDSDPYFPDEQYYIRGLDLQARVDEINRFVPDITFDIHFDAHDTKKFQTSTDEVKSYVPGGFMNQAAPPLVQNVRETGSRHSRALALKHLLEPSRWTESVELASSVVQSMSTRLGILPRKLESSSTIKVKDGVFARNLFMTLHSTQGLFVYLECLNYDYPAEFYKLAKLDRMGSYRGKTFYYSSRLDQVATGIREGIQGYFTDLSDNVPRQ